MNDFSPTHPLQLSFQDGTLLLNAPLETDIPLSRWAVFDARIGQWRADAGKYPEIFSALYRLGIPVLDQARAYQKISLQLPAAWQPRDYQQEALQHWSQAGKRGIVVLPTGTGKTFVAELCMAAAGRSTLVVVPTIDLMTQWATNLEKCFQQKIGMLGGGVKEILPITVSTYDSARIMLDFIGNRFGLLIVDECHHLPGPSYQQIARCCIAPWRLGLSATPERDDGGDKVLEELLGPICYRKEINELNATVLAPYQTQRVLIPLDADEYNQYQTSRQKYLQFLRRYRINLSTSMGWSQFLIACSRHPEGREVLRAFFLQKRIALGARHKLDYLRQLLEHHKNDRILIFTADNATAYRIGERFLLPVLTHHTKASERKDFLDKFRSGLYPCLVTSKVLNEGVDVPEANVGIVVSGTGSTREHVQRLGRILRPAQGKSAILYELISDGTGEEGQSERRRQNIAYEGTRCL